MEIVLYKHDDVFFFSEISIKRYSPNQFLCVLGNLCWLLLSLFAVKTKYSYEYILGYDIC